MKKRIINIIKEGLVPTSGLISKELQEVIDKYSSKGNIIYFPKGEYVLSTVFLRDHTHIKFARGTKILGSKNFYDFSLDEKVDYPLYQDNSHSYFHCSLFVGEHIKDVSITGKGLIDMQSVWDEDNVRNIVHRGVKVIALKEVNNFVLKDFKAINATDLAIYFAGCKHGLIDNIKLKVYIDGISPDCSKDIKISNCDVISGDDGIVLKSSYTLNRLESTENIKVTNCKIKSRCNAIKFGTESNGDFKNISFDNISIKDSRITAISIESVDGAHIENIKFNNILIKNSGTPLFIYVGDRLRGPKGSKIGSIKNIYFNNIKAIGPYHLYKCIPWNYITYKNNDDVQFPGYFSTNKKEKPGEWQISSLISGLPSSHIENIYLKDIYFELDGGVNSLPERITEPKEKYPEVSIFGKILPAKGIYARFTKNLHFDNVIFKFLHNDIRKEIIIDN